MSSARNPWSLVLLLIPFAALLYPPVYAHVKPAVLGVPFFIWYQFLWVVIGSLIVYAVYLLRRTDEEVAP